MCAIGGVCLRPETNLDVTKVLTGMLTKQRHRGPDSDGVFLNKARGVGLCHNRLAILDLTESGTQPMHSADGQYSIVFNGEIYNWKELKKGLESVGFCSRTDTEILLVMYQKYGVKMLSRLRGMFAFAIFDQVKNIIFCARDRIGKKPFVYAETKHGIAFASEIPAVLCMPDCDTELDQSGLACMLLHNLRHIPDPHTVYRGLKRLRPGHAMLIKRGKVDRVWRYWTPKANALAGSSEHLRDVLEDAVHTRMVADVPVGALLSGGVDSTAIVNLMQQKMNEPVHTYAFGADENDEDIRRARIVSKQLGTQHKEFYFDPKRQFEVFKTMLATYGEPIMLLPLIHAYQLSEAIHDDGIKVVLNGNGADELFYGYTGHLNTARITRMMNAFGWCRHFLPENRHPSLSLLMAQPGMRKAMFYRMKAEKTWPAIFRKEVVSTLQNIVSDEMESWGKLFPNKDFIDESNFLALLIENTHSLTISSDIPGMMASIEMRSPFLDQQVISEAMGIHFSKKVKGPKDGSQLKHILRQAVKDLVPPAVMHAPKRGFGMGVQERDVLLGPWRGQVDSILNNYPYPSLFNEGYIKKIWKDAKSSEKGDWSMLAKLFSIGLWEKES